MQEKNETKIWNEIFTSLNRTDGNAVPVMAQKSLLGHSKGGSAAWQMAGLLQSVVTGIVPGNRNSDNIDTMFKQHTYLMFPAVPVHTDGISAGVMSSFGFGQVGGTALVLHPRYLFGALTPSQYTTYKSKNVLRGQQAYKSMTEMMITNSLVKIKEAPPYTPELEIPVLMNSLARATLDPKTGSYAFTSKLPKGVVADGANAKTVSDVIAGTGAASGVGVDQGTLQPNPWKHSTLTQFSF